MEVIENKALKMLLRNPDRVTSVIPRSKNLGEVKPGIHEVLVHFGLEESQILKNLKLKGVRSPIAFQYEWPGLYAPFDHQKTTAEFLTLHRRCYVFNEQGTGKSAAALWAADYLLKTNRIKRVLIISPVSIMRAAWVADAFKCVMHRTIAVAHGSREQRKTVIDGDAEVVVINYDGVDIMKESLAGKFDLLILDEANYIKTATTRRWKSISSIVNQDTWLWLMTGTPASQSPLDAYGLAKLCTPSRVPSFFGAWRDKTMNKINMFKWTPAPRATEFVNDALQPAIRFTKEECLDLPEMLYQTRDVEMSKQQTKFYNELRKRMTINAAGAQITAVHAASALNKLLQLSLGSAYTDTGEVVEFDAGSRLEAMLEVVRESSHKTVVFAPFKHTIRLVTDALDKAGITVDTIYGEVPLSKRTEIFKRFQETDDPQVLVIQPQSAAHGVTLTAASTIIWYGPTMSVETYLQGNARIHRAGQTNKTLVVRLCGSDVERKIYAALDKKELAQEKLLEMYESVVKGE